MKWNIFIGIVFLLGSCNSVPKYSLEELKDFKVKEISHGIYEPHIIEVHSIDNSPSENQIISGGNVKHIKQ